MSSSPLRCLVTGGTGFIGSRVVRRLREEGHEVHLLVRAESSFGKLGEVARDLICHRGNLRDPESIRRIVGEAGPEVCIHLAWDVPPGRYLHSPSNLENVRYSLQLAEELAANGCRKLVGVGTCFELESSSEPLGPEAPIGPLSTYAASKAGLRQILAGFCDDQSVEFVWARLFYLYGPGEAPGRLVPAVVRAVSRGAPARVTKGPQLKDYLHVDDVANALALLATTDARGTFNIGSGAGVSVADVARTITELAGRPDLLQLGALETRKNEPPYIVADPTSLKDATGWKSEIDLRSGLGEMVEIGRGGRIAACRSCGSNRLELILDLGETPLANELLPSGDASDQDTFPLEVVYCGECHLVQLTHTVSAERLFRHYLYTSSTSTTILANAEQAVAEATERRPLDANDLVVEIASNDGYLLKHYVAAGIPVLGIEPATNIAEIATRQGIPTRNEFFGREFATELAEEGIRASVVHANNVLAHVGDLSGFVRGIEILLREDGIATIEVPYLGDLIDHCEFDTIYHEHLCYFSVTALEGLFARHDLHLFDVQRISIHGGSLRLFVSRMGARQRTEAVERLLVAEEGLGMTSIGAYRDFADRVNGIRDDLLSLLESERAGGKTIGAYGAAAKGSTLLNYCGIGTDLVEFAVDANPLKQGLTMPGTRQPIFSPARLADDPPDLLLLLAWNHAPEIFAQQAAFIAGGGRFIVPVPEPKIAP